MSANGQYQLIVANATSGLFLSSDSGITWTPLTGGLPTLTGSPFWCDGVISANGQYITLSVYGGSLWMSSDYGRTFALTNQSTPNIWLPLNGSVTDSMGLSAVTTPGTVPGYVTLNRPGYTTRAVNLVNTAGSTASQYIRGTWTGASNFTISGWFNAQTVNATQQMIYSAYQNQFVLLITSANQLQAFTPSGGAGSGIVIGTTSFTITANTWYYFTTTYRTGGICSFYVNNTLIGTTTNVGGIGTLTSTQFSLGTYDISLASAFNGYISDLKIAHSVSTYVPIPHLAPNYWIPFESDPPTDLGSNVITSQSPAIYITFDGTVTDSIGASNPYSTGSFVSGKVGTNAINLANTAGANPSQNVRGTWAGAANFTVSFWMNPRTLNGTTQHVFNAYDGFFVIMINPSNQLYAARPRMSGGSRYIDGIGTTGTLTVNTWYFVTVIFQTDGLCSFYVNDALIGTNTNTGGPGVNNSNFRISGTNYSDSAFDGYIDDFRIHNYAITYLPAAPITVTGSIVSASGVVGQYAVNLANTAGSTALNYITGTWSGAPNFTVSFWCNTSSLGASQVVFGSYSTFLDVFINTSNQLTLYLPTGATTNVLAITGPTISSNTWYQVTVIFQSGGVCSLYVNGTLYGPYTHSGVLPTCTQFCLGTYGNNNFTNAFRGLIDDFRIYNAAIPYHILVPQNYKSIALSGTGQYALAAAMSGRVVGSSDASKTWNKQAVTISSQAPFTSSLSINHSGQYQMVATGSASGSVMPNQSGLAAATWFQGGVNWVTTSSSTYNGTTPAYCAFNNLLTSLSWAGAGSAYSSSSPYAYTANTYSTAIVGIAASPVAGDWLQLQSYTPLVMYSYTWQSSGIAQHPKNYYIVGSNDGATWYPIQYAVGVTTPFTAANQLCSTYLLANSTSTQTIQGGQAGSFITTSYSTSASAYTYFRLIVTNNWGYLNGNTNVGQWYINFQNSVSYSTDYGSTWLNTSPSASSDTITLSPSGQYAISTNSVTPFARLTLDNTGNDQRFNLTAVPGGGSAYSYSDTNKMVGSYSLNIVNSPGATSGITYFKYTVPTVLNTPPILSMFGWIYISSLPTTNNSVPFVLGDLANNSIGSGIFINPSGSLNLACCTSVAPTATDVTTSTILAINTWYHTGFTFSAGRYTLYLNGQSVATQYYGGTMRTRSPGTNIVNVALGCGFAAWAAFNGFIDDVRIYTSALSADEVNSLYKNPSLTQTIAISNSYPPITSYSEPILPGITANVVDTAVSQTGQYMVAVTSDTTNNVYYSTDYGVTFTALTVDTNIMTSCSISYDGSYITVENDTNIYTLNRNTQGFSVAIGNQAGKLNQSINSIAIGNQAGQTNQSANSIVLNATGNALNATGSGMYMAPIATIASSASTYVSLLGYGMDGQTVQTGLSVLSNGNVGIGTTAPSYALHVVGNIYATGDITAFSDQRYKQNIIRLDRSLDAIRSLSGYSYTREDHRPGEKQIGLLAQEVLTVFPEAISYDSANDKYSVNYNCLIAPVVESIKELYDRVEAQAQMIETQRHIIQQLVDRLGPQ
jgi:hypothetical protein